MLDHDVSAPAVPWFATSITLEGLLYGSAEARWHAHHCMGEEEAQADDATINSSARDVVAGKILLYCPLNLVFILTS